jgi:hypothetical protein
LLALAILQALVASGQPFGRLVWGGAHEVLPPKLRIGSVISIVLYALFALVLIDRSGLASVFGGGAFGVVAAWVLFGYFILGIFMNAISRSTLERKVMVPVTVILAVCTLFIALN